MLGEEVGVSDVHRRHLRPFSPELTDISHSPGLTVRFSATSLRPWGILASRYRAIGNSDCTEPYFLSLFFFSLRSDASQLRSAAELRPDLLHPSKRQSCAAPFDEHCSVDTFFAVLTAGDSFVVRPTLASAYRSSEPSAASSCAEIDAEKWEHQGVQQPSMTTPPRAKEKEKTKTTMSLSATTE
jgi:hypothetical protein